MRSFAPAVAAFILGSALSVVAFFVVQTWEQELSIGRFEDVAHQRAIILRQNFLSVLEPVESIGALYAASETVTRAEFAVFAAAEIGERLGIQALEWIPRVRASERAAYEAAARRDGYPAFTFTEREDQGRMVAAAAREEHFPVFFVEPHEGNEAAFGFDMASNPARLKALHEARDSGKTVASGRITLVQETGDQYGFLLFDPIYRRGAPTDTVAERRGNLLGFALGVLRVGNVVESSLEESQSGEAEIDIFVFDRSGPAGRQLLYPKSAHIGGRTDLRSPFCVDKPSTMASRDWLFTLCPAGDADLHASRWQSWTVLAFGMLISGMLAAYLRMLSMQRARIERFAEELQVSRAESDRVRDDLSRLIDTANAPIFGVDRRGHINEWNQAAAQVTGYGKDEVLDCSLVDEFVAEGHKAPVKEVLDKALKGEATANFEFPLSVKSGGDVLLLLNATPRRDAGGRIVGVIGVGQDITERTRLAVELIQSAKLATLGEMSTGLAHELNQPLNVIRMAADSSLERIEEGEVDAKFLHGKFERISAQVERAAKVIDHMRIFGRKADERPENLDLSEVVKGALGLIGEQLRLLGIEVETRFPERCPKVSGHAVQLEQVVLNLIGNARDAIEANRQGKGDARKISLIVEQAGSENMVDLIVEDSGGGIPANLLDRVFEPFFTTKEVGKGTGLGLSISYGIVTDMGGTMKAANLDDGARITVTLPVVDEDAAAD